MFCACKMKVFCALIVVLLHYVSAIKPTDPDISISNITEIVSKNGYPIESYEIETEDGYILGTFRIPYGRRSATKQTNKYPVVVMHGLFANAESFLITGPDKALGYTLADNGYDVWLCNARGNHHSRKHKSLDPDRDKSFWQFSWDEIGVYDIPAIIDYVLNTTNKKKLHYVGHSQGSITFFVMGSERPKYNKKIKVAVTLSAPVLMNYMKPSIFKLLAPFYPVLENLANFFQVYEVVPPILSEILHRIEADLCGQDSTILDVCKNILAIFGGFNDEQLDLETIPLILATLPAGSSVYQLFHFSQVVLSGSFKKYDWGKQENLRRYGSETPPEYNLRNVTAPVALFFSENDLVSVKDTLHLASVLPNVVELYKVPYKNWTHIDFVWAKDIDTFLHKRVLKVLKDFNNE